MGDKIFFRCAGIMMLVLFLPLFLSAQANGDVDPAPGAGRTDVAPVTVDGRIIFYVRGIYSFTARHRADAISERITAAAADPLVKADSVRLEQAEDRTRVFAGSRFIMNIYDTDASREGIRREVLSELIHQKISQVIGQYHLERSRPVIVRNLICTLAGTLVLGILIFALLWILRWVNRLIQRRLSERINRVEDKSFRLIQSGQLWKVIKLSLRFLRILTIILLVAAYFQFVLGLFPWTRQIAEYTIGLFLDPLRTLGQGLISFLPDLAFLVVIYFVTRYLLKLIRMLFNGLQSGEMALGSFRTEWAIPTFRIVRIFVIVFAVIVAYPYIPGSDTNAFKGVSVFLGVLLSLGSSSLVGNIIAGYSMTYRGAFKPGDRIRVDGQFGIVEEQKLMVTRLRTLKNEEIVVPNSALLNSSITNYSSRTQDPGLILHTEVGIGYETPWRQVEAMLKLAAARTEGLLKEPAPFVHQKLLGDFAVTYELNVYCNDAAMMPELYSRMHRNIQDVFNENNVQIMTPSYEADPPIPKVVPPDQWHTPLARTT